MPDTFYDGEDALRQLIEEKDIRGDWTRTEDGSKVVFRSREGGIMNYWPNKGTIQYQGKLGPKEHLQAALADYQPAEKAVVSKGREPRDERTSIFIVHGHDGQAKDQLELILRRLNLQPYILQNNDTGGNTIIEALEQHIYEEAAFGIVLLTPDDYGFAKADGDEEQKPRARQNVILEMGMVMASLSRPKMAILKKGNLEIPSDVDGVLRLDFNEHVNEVGVKLAKKMKAAGIDIDDALIPSCAG